MIVEATEESSSSEDLNKTDDSFDVTDLKQMFSQLVQENHDLTCRNSSKPRNISKSPVRAGLFRSPSMPKGQSKERSRESI